MNEIGPLVDTIDRLLAPDGCPWDREQTLQSMRSSIIEEAYEAVEAIETGKDRYIEEEIGDLLFLVLFLCRLAEKEGRFNLRDAAGHITAKLIRRHPHVFGEASIKDSNEVLAQWESIKADEKKEHQSGSVLDGIPKDLPALSRAYKIAKRINRHPFTSQTIQHSTDQEAAGEELWKMVLESINRGVEPEQALRKRLGQIGAEFRKWEINRDISKG